MSCHRNVLRWASAEFESSLFYEGSKQNIETGTFKNNNTQVFFLILYIEKRW